MSIKCQNLLWEHWTPIIQVLVGFLYAVIGLQTAQPRLEFLMWDPASPSKERWCPASLPVSLAWLNSKESDSSWDTGLFSHILCIFWGLGFVVVRWKYMEIYCVCVSMFLIFDDWGSVQNGWPFPGRCKRTLQSDYLWRWRLQRPGQEGHFWPIGGQIPPQVPWDQILCRSHLLQDWSSAAIATHASQGLLSTRQDFVCVARAGAQQQEQQWASHVWSEMPILWALLVWCCICFGSRNACSSVHKERPDEWQAGKSVWESFLHPGSASSLVSVLKVVCFFIVFQFQVQSMSFYFTFHVVLLFLHLYIYIYFLIFEPLNHIETIKCLAQMFTIHVKPKFLGLHFINSPW